MTLVVNTASAPDTPGGSAANIEAWDVASNPYALTILTDQPSSGNWHWATQATGETPAVPDGSGGWSGTVLESGTVAVGLNGVELDIPTTGTTGDGQRRMCLYQRIGTVDSTQTLQILYTADNTPPVASAPAALGSDGAIDFAFTTNEAGGVAYVVVQASATPPTADQIRFGLDNTGAAALATGIAEVQSAGQLSFQLTNLTNGVAVNVFAVQFDQAQNAGNVVTAGATPGTVATDLDYIGGSFTAYEMIKTSTNTNSFTGGTFNCPAGTNRMLEVFVFNYASTGTAISDVQASLGGIDLVPVSTASFGLGTRPGGTAFRLMESDISSLPADASLSVTLNANSQGLAAIIVPWEGVSQLLPIQNITGTRTGGIAYSATLTKSEENSVGRFMVAAKMVDAGTPTLTSDGLHGSVSGSGESRTPPQANDPQWGLIEDFGPAGTREYTIGYDNRFGQAASFAYEIRRN
jgi:hypothetical protein